MNLTKTTLNGLTLSAVLAAALLTAPAVSSAQSTSGQPRRMAVAAPAAVMAG